MEYENNESKKVISLQSDAEVISYLKNNFSNDMFFGYGVIDEITKKLLNICFRKKIIC